jgi:hypothetical protein
MKILQNQIGSFFTNFGGKLSSILSFLFPETKDRIELASTAATYIFIAPTYTSTIITLEPCALNAEFQHFILSLWKPLKEVIPGESRKNRG